MTIVDKINASTRATMQEIFDKEPVNYLEAASMYGIIAQGRHTLSVLSVLYNHAQDPELKKLIKESMDNLTIPTIEHCESFLRDSDAPIPQFHFSEHHLHEFADIPSDLRLTDSEIAATIGSMTKAAQILVLAALHSSYQLQIGLMFRKILDKGLDWNYRLLQLMLNRGWLPNLAKVVH